MTEIIAVRFKNGGKEYYFNPESDGTQGRMYRNETTPDGHRVDENGAKIQ